MTRLRKALSLWLVTALGVSALAGALVLVGPRGHGKPALALDASGRSQVFELHAAHGSSLGSTQHGEDG